MTNETNSYLDAMRKAGMGNFKKNQEKEAFLTSVTASKATLEIVPVAMAPSFMFDVFVDSWFDQMDRIFRGPNFNSRPELTGDDESDRALYLRYLETLFWRKMVSIHPEYCKEQSEKNLKSEIRRNVVTPGLFANAVAALGVVTVNNLGIRLQPEYMETYNYKERILNTEEYIQVVSWLEELMDWGFVGFNGFNSDEAGSLEFMLMTASDSVVKVEEDEVADEEVSDSKAKDNYCEFVIKSQKASANVIALYRYFFYNEKMKYISDYRNAYTYSTFEDNAENVRYIVKRMIWDDSVPEFLSVDKARTPKSETADTDAEVDVQK